MPAPGSNGYLYQFYNCRILRDHNLVADDLWVRDGKILNPEKIFFDEKCSADIKIDCEGQIVCPGFIDVQINGAFGVDFSLNTDDVEEGVRKVAKGLLAHGVTSFCPTIVTSPVDVYQKVIPRIKKCNGSADGAGILGLHLEGPFINKEKKGAHEEQFIRAFPSGIQDVLQTYGCLDSAAIVTLAPELDNSELVIKELCARGVHVSLGHSMANLLQGEEAISHGACFITHLFNAMLPFHHRDPHLVGLLASQRIPTDKCIYYGLIADGIHTHPAALRIAHSVHPSGLVLVTDAISAMGLPSGVHHIGSQKIEICGKRAVIAGTNTLCGSIATMNLCVKHLNKEANCGVVNSLESATLHPASMLGITNSKGTLDYNTDADFLILDYNLDVQATYIAGEKVWDVTALKDCMDMEILT
ncbi:hypothetical protein ACJMK2_030670 [Sinanodonta woodiana]|uniref:N-acetylglucosamine-6-phosphate deacetylase n=1 Tax=Sinanodonta woodiana TaxID=1069815 RepID=A0ABD3WX00_SINWO